VRLLSVSRSAPSGESSHGSRRVTTTSNPPDLFSSPRLLPRTPFRDNDPHRGQLKADSPNDNPGVEGLRSTLRRHSRVIADDRFLQCTLARVQCSPRTRRIGELFTGVGADGICKQQAWESGHLPAEPALYRRSGAAVFSGKYDFPASEWSWTGAAAALGRSVKPRSAPELPSEILQHPHVSAEH
jgi:hypothetical protein